MKRFFSFHFLHALFNVGLHICKRLKDMKGNDDAAHQIINLWEILFSFRNHNKCVYIMILMIRNEPSTYFSFLFSVTPYGFFLSLNSIPPLLGWKMFPTFSLSLSSAILFFLFFQRTYIKTYTFLGIAFCFLFSYYYTSTHALGLHFISLA